MTKPIILFAMEQEAYGEFEDLNVLYTGIGKVNAVYHLTKSLEQKPSLIVNCGTAGSVKHPQGSIINCTSFIQRDMDATALGFDPFQTPFSDRPIIINYGLHLENITQGLCGSGDSFDTSNNDKFDVVDMEGFALADICERESIPFLCLKYISDGPDNKAREDWNTTLSKASKALRQVLDEHSIL